MPSVEDAKQRWCCFWDTTKSNLWAVAIHGLFASIFFGGQCVGIYFFANYFNQVEYLPPPPEPGAPPRPPVEEFDDVTGLGILFDEPETTPSPVEFVNIRLSLEHENLLKRIQAADWSFSGKGGIGTIHKDEFRARPIRRVLNRRERDIYVISSMILMGVNAMLLLISLLLIFKKDQLKRWVIDVWLIADVIYVACDSIFHVLLIYTLLNFPRLDMIIWTTWFHTIGAFIIIACFVRVSCQIYAFLFMKDLRGITGASSVEKKRDLEDQIRRAHETQMQNRAHKRQSSTKRLLMLAADAKVREQQQGSLQVAIERLKKLNTQTDDYFRNLSNFRRPSFFKQPAKLEGDDERQMNKSNVSLPTIPASPITDSPMSIETSNTHLSASMPEIATIHTNVYANSNNSPIIIAAQRRESMQYANVTHLMAPNEMGTLNGMPRHRRLLPALPQPQQLRVPDTTNNVQPDQDVNVFYNNAYMYR